MSTEVWKGSDVCTLHVGTSSKPFNNASPSPLHEMTSWARNTHMRTTY
ncbi:hypothetical protein V3C99_018885 [Haemonchus contortus]|uniref:Uncharacterized protein n=1 Tax=Haemonchus contortus TaxID=6289 RepID=A0A7I4YZC8_HAECO